MSAYLALQILKGKLDYTTVIAKFPKYKDEIDIILIEECHQELIK